MNDLKSTVARNIAALRQGKGMTQLELAEQLNYSDKAVSKWERAESMPDISVLVDLCDLFGVSLDALVRGEEPKPQEPPEKRPQYRRSVICLLSVLLVWFLAMTSFVMLNLFSTGLPAWLSFIYALPVSMIVWLVFNSLWFRRRMNYLIISILMWTALVSVHLTFLMLGTNIWMIYLLGVPGQLILLVWPAIHK